MTRPVYPSPPNPPQGWHPVVQVLANYVVENPFPPKQYDAADLPAASSFTRCVAVVQDENRLAFSDGATWQRIATTGDVGAAASVLAKSVTSASTTAVTTEETLWSYSLPAGTLASDGQAVLIRVRGYMAANTHNKTVALKFGSTTLHTFSATNSGLTWQIEALVQRSGATAQLTSGLRQHSGGFSTIHGSASETLANAITISLTGKNATASAGDITFDAALVEFKP